MYRATSDATAKGRGAARVIPCFDRSGEVGYPFVPVACRYSNMTARARKGVDRKDKGPMI